MRLTVLKQAAIAFAMPLMLALAGGSALAQSGPPPATPAAPPPVAAFARLPAVQQAEISPDGLRIAILGGSFDQRQIVISPVDGQQFVTIPLGAVDVNAIRWAGDGFLVATVRVYDSRTNFGDGRVYSYNLQRDLVFDMAGNIKGMLLDGVSWAGFAINRPILGDVAGDKPAVVMQGLDLGATAGDNFSRFEKKDALVAALYRVDVATGKGRMTERGNPATNFFAVDRAGEARVRQDSDKGMTSLFARRKGTQGWTLIDRSESMAPSVRFMGYSDSEDAIYLATGSETGIRILRRNLADGSQSDIGPVRPAAAPGLLWDRHTDTPTSIVGGLDRPEYQWLDARLGAVHARMSRALKGRDVHLLNWSRDRARFIVRGDSPSQPPLWLLYDATTNQLSPIGEEYPELTGWTPGVTTWHSFKASDGFEMGAYLTLPAGAGPGSPAPLIVMPHGGPVSRDDFQFDWWEQFLVSRGYAVLKPQFRGSGGFGLDYVEAGYGEWGGKMQSDLIDAIAAVADKGVDPARACIVGASFGGYSALHGATVRSDRYRCAISVNGVSDLRTMIGHSKIYFGGESETVRYFRDVIGDTRVEQAAVDAASPYRRAGAKTAPILLIHAVNDTTVPLQQSQLMESALKTAGSPYQFLLLDGDDHYLSSAKSRQQMLEASEAFLARYLPVKK